MVAEPQQSLERDAVGIGLSTRQAALMAMTSNSLSPGPVNVSSSSSRSSPAPGPLRSLLMASNRTWAIRVALLLLSLTVTSILAEGAYRMARRARYRNLAASWSHELYELRPERDYVYVMRPGPGTSHVEGTGASWSYHINSLGLRGPELGSAGASRARVLVLGDSYTFGWAVADDEPYARVLAGLLEQGELPVEVVNAGTPGYNTVQQAALLEELWERVRPDIVVLGFVMNDAEPPRSVPCPPDVLYGFASSWLFEELKRVSHAPLPSKLYERRDYVDEFAPGRPERASCRAALGAIVERCRAAAVPVLIFVLPDLSQPLDGRYAYGAIHATVRAWGAELNVPVFDLFEVLSGQDHEAYGVPGDMHPDAAAHRVFAREIAREVEARLSR